MAGCSGFSKGFMFVIGLIFWAAAAGLCYLGVWGFIQHHRYEHLAEHLYIIAPATIIIAAAFFFFVLGIFGCVGACKEQRCLLALFFSLLLLIFVGMVCAGVLGWMYRDNVDKAMHDGLHQGLHDYNLENETYWKEEIDFMQTNLQCCGVDNYTDWKKTPWAQETHRPYPDSCCKSANCSIAVNGTTPVYQEGCLPTMKDMFKTNLGIVAGVSAAFALILILGMIFSCVLICKRRSEVPYVGLNEPSGMRV